MCYESTYHVTETELEGEVYVYMDLNRGPNDRCYGQPCHMQFAAFLNQRLE